MKSIGLYLFISVYCTSVLLLLILGFTVVSMLCGVGVLGGTLLCIHMARAPLHSSLAISGAGVLLALARVALVPAAYAETADHSMELEGTVVAIPDLRETSEKITVRTSIDGKSVEVLATVPLYPSIHAGDRVRLYGKPQAAEPFETDGGRTFLYDQFLRKDGIEAIVPSARADVIGRSGSVWLRFVRLLEALKEWLSRSLATILPEPESALAVGILVGGKQGLGQKLIDDFTASGMLQIIVLSGFNVMIVANALMAALSRIPKHISFTLALASIASFVLMSGAGTSAIRAGVMAGFALAARAFKRTYAVTRVALLALFLMSLWNPLALAYDPGLQFSFIATFGLILGTPIISPYLQFIRSKTAIEMIATTLAAEIALLPLLLYDTGNLSFVSVAANVLVMPAIPFAMAASAAGAALAQPLTHISSILPLVIGLPAYVPLAYVIGIATHMASLPFSNHIIPAFPFWVVLVSYGALAVIVRSATRPHQENDSPPLPSSNYRRTHLRTTSSLTACSQPYTHAPTGR